MCDSEHRQKLAIVAAKSFVDYSNETF